MPTNATVASKGWSFDRTVSPTTIFGLVALAGGLVAQSYVALGWATNVTNRLEELERAHTRVLLSIAEGDKRIMDRGDERFRGITYRLDGLEVGRAGDRERLTRVEEQFRWVAESLSRIERKLDGAGARR